jgi:hypothetical protein
MRFPNPREVERACFYGKYMKIKVCDAALNVATHSDVVDTKSRMHKALVRVRIIHIEKRCEENAAYVGPWWA